MSCCSTVTDKVPDTSNEGTKGEVDIANDVERKTVVSEDNREEREVGEEFEEVCVNVRMGLWRWYSQNPGTYL